MALLEWCKERFEKKNNARKADVEADQSNRKQS
jgi:hypothetical protein